MADTNHTPIVKILLDLGVADLGDISTDKDYLKALIRATNQLNPRDGRYPILQKEIQKLRAISFARGGPSRKGNQVAQTQSSTKLSPSRLKGSTGASDISSKLSVIEGNLQGILNVFKSQFNLDKKKAENDRKAQEDALKKGREGKLESTGADIPGTKILKKATKPVTGFLDKILTFFQNILMGSAILGLLKILENPDGFLQPIKDFIDGIIGFFNEILKTVFGVLYAPINLLIDGLNIGIKGVMTALDGAIRLFNPDHKGTEDFPTIPHLEAPQIPTFSKKEDVAEKVKSSSDTSNKDVANQAPSSNLGKDMLNSGGSTFTTGSGGFRAFNKGGMAKGTDTVPAMLTPGEVVMSKPAVDYWGADNLLSMNKEGGGTNKSSNMGGYQGGGIIPRKNGGVTSKATVGTSSPSVRTINPSSSRGKVTVLPLSRKKNGSTASSSGASADQKSVSSFSSVDVNNSELWGIKAQYSLVAEVG